MDNEAIMRTLLRPFYCNRSKEAVLNHADLGFALIYDPRVVAKLHGQLEEAIWRRNDFYSRKEDIVIGRILINRWYYDALSIAETALALRRESRSDLDCKYLQLLDSFQDGNKDLDITTFLFHHNKKRFPIIRKARMFFQEEDCALKIAPQRLDPFSFTLSRNEIIEKWCRDQKITCYLLEGSDIFDPVSESLDQHPAWSKLATNFADYFASMLEKENIIPPPYSLTWLSQRIHLSAALASRHLTNLLDKALPSQFMISCHGNIDEQIMACAMSHQGKSVIASDHGSGLCLIENDYLKLYALSGAETFISYNSLSCEKLAPFLLHNRDESDRIFQTKIGDIHLSHISSLTRKKKLKRFPMRKSPSIIFEPFFSSTKSFFIASYHLHAINSTQLNIYMLTCLISLGFKITLRPHPADNMPLLNKLASHFGSCHVKLSRSIMESICDWHDFIIMTDSTTTAMKAVLSSGRPFIIFDCSPHRISDFAKRAFNSHGIYKEINLNDSIDSQISAASIKSDMDVALERTSCQDPFWF